MKTDFAQIVRPLLEWYGKNARTLPWREDPAPYRVWISEIMLQQTRVEAVLPYYERFLSALPSVGALAEAPEEQLLKLWEGLGYYSRVKNLQKAARMVVECWNGELPADAEELKKLPGVGDYTAGAIASIACGKPEPAVDGNVLRVCARLLASRENVGSPSVKRRCTELLRRVYPQGEEGAFTQAMMELGAMVCLPNGAPRCGECPLADLCAGRREGIAASLPVKTRNPARKIERKTVFLILCGERVALRKRPEGGLLGGLWEFPNVAGNLPAQCAERVLKKWEILPRTMEPTAEAKHVFTHLEWKMSGYTVSTGQTSPDFEWVPYDRLETSYAIPSAFKTFLNLLREHGGYVKI